MQAKMVLWSGGAILILLMILWSILDEDPLLIFLEILCFIGHLFIGFWLLGDD